MTGNDNRHGLIIQDRDRQLLGELSRMRVIDREQAKLVAGFGSTTRVNTRLLALTRAGLLRQFFLGTAKGGAKALYALSKKGAELVGVPHRGPRRRTGETLVVDRFVQHQLAINQIHCVVAYEPIPIEGARFVRWIAFFDPLSPGSALIPDGYFEITTTTGTIAAFLEVDLGDERPPVWRAKVESYLRFAISGDFDRQFHQSQFRVLVLADSERRLQSLRKATRAVTEKIFWFAIFESIDGPAFWSAKWWRSGEAERQTLL